MSHTITLAKTRGRTPVQATGVMLGKRTGTPLCHASPRVLLLRGEGAGGRLTLDVLYHATPHKL